MSVKILTVPDERFLPLNLVERLGSGAAYAPGCERHRQR
jgi:hypothetical protein